MMKLSLLFKADNIRSVSPTESSNLMNSIHGQYEILMLPSIKHKYSEKGETDGSVL
jgi:hypothetical protein